MPLELTTPSLITLALFFLGTLFGQVKYVTDCAPGFIDLTAAFTSAAPATVSGRSWLLLESVGDGTWYEIDRRP